MATMSTAPTGSTAPHNVPARNALGRDMPLAVNGSDTTAPSGTFWMAMPRESATTEQA